jgi:hypothetical protein
LEPKAWMAQCETMGHGIRRASTISLQEHLETLVILGLRMNEGINPKTFLVESKGISLNEVIFNDNGQLTTSF